MHTWRWRWLAVAAWLSCAGVSHAHFLFVRILPHAEGGRFGEVYFSEYADAGDPRFIDKIAGTRLWLQAKPGVFEPLQVRKGDDRLRALIPASGSFAVVGECTYGVLARAKQPAFLLRHYPKAVHGKPDEIATLKAKPEVPFEILVRADDKGLEFSVLRQGKPVPNAKLTAVAVNLKSQDFSADAEGKARWQPASAGAYAVYTGQTLKEAGVNQGKKYDEVREFTTVAFTWPLDPQGADADAVKLFDEATGARAAWQDFPGFSADIAARVDGRPWKGTATVGAAGDVDLFMEDDPITPWVREQLESIVLHRRARQSGKPPVLRFADQDRDHPLGRLLTFEGGKFASSYRVKDRQIMTVNRQLGKSNMTITVLDNDKNADGRFLPRSYTVQYWDAATGELQRTETVQNRWTRLGAWDLPAALTSVASGPAGQSVKALTLSQHRLLDKK